MINWWKINNIEGKTRWFFHSFHFYFCLWGNQFKLKCCCFSYCKLIENTCSKIGHVALWPNEYYIIYFKFLLCIELLPSKIVSNIFKLFDPNSKWRRFICRFRLYLPFNSWFSVEKGIIENKNLVVCWKAKTLFRPFWFAFDVCFSQSPSHSPSLCMCTYHSFYKLFKKRQTNPFEMPVYAALTRQSSINAAKE